MVNQEYTTSFGETVTDYFKLYDKDVFDIGGLIVQVIVSGNDITEDCQCLTFEAEYETSSGQKDFETDI